MSGTTHLPKSQDGRYRFGFRGVSRAGGWSVSYYSSSAGEGSGVSGSASGSGSVGEESDGSFLLVINRDQ